MISDDTAKRNCSARRASIMCCCFILKPSLTLIMMFIVTINNDLAVSLALIKYSPNFIKFGINKTECNDFWNTITISMLNLRN